MLPGRSAAIILLFFLRCVLFFFVRCVRGVGWLRLVVSKANASVTGLRGAAKLVAVILLVIPARV
jgi:hypothetical protein